MQPPKVIKMHQIVVSKIYIFNNNTNNNNNNNNNTNNNNSNVKSDLRRNTL